MNRKLLFEMIDCAKRECSMRKWVYPKWISQGKIKKEKAEREEFLMKQIKELLIQIYNGSAPEEVIQQTLNFGE